MNTVEETIRNKRADEISVRDLILKTREYLFLLLKYWYLIFAGGLLLGGKHYNDVNKTPITFPGKFALYIKTKTNAKDNSFVLKSYHRLAVSKSVIERVLFEKISIKKDKDFVANFYVDIYQSINSKNLSSNIPKGFKFKHDLISEFNKEERQVFQILLNEFSKSSFTNDDGYLVASVEENIGFINVSFASPSDELTVQVLHAHYNVLNQLYFDSSLQGFKKSHEELTIMVDSVRRMYKETYFELLQKKEKRIQYLDQLASLQKKKKSKDIEYEFSEEATKDEQKYHRKINHLMDRIHQLDINASLYKTEYESSLAKLREIQKDKTIEEPLIFISEITQLPIEPYKPSAVRSGILGIILGSVLVIFIILSMKIYKDIIAESQK